MSAQEESFQELLARLRTRDEDAANDVFRIYAQRLIALAHSRMDSAMRQRVDPEDVVQSVFRTFFRRHAAGEFDLANRDSLWALLALITVRKCVVVARRHQREPADTLATDAHGRSLWDSIVAAEPSPEAAVELTDLLENLLRDVPGDYQQIVVLTLQGEDAAAITGQTRCSRAKVYRVREYLRDYLEQLVASAV